MYVCLYIKALILCTKAIYSGTDTFCVALGHSLYIATWYYVAIAIMYFCTQFIKIFVFKFTLSFATTNE